MTIYLPIEYLPYLLIGLGVGYLLSLATAKSPSELERRQHDVSVKKEWLRMLGEKNVRR